MTSTYTYDRLNRLVGIGYPTTSLNITYAYDQADATTGCSGSFPKGRLTRMTDASGSTTYCYDRRGNVLKKTQVAGGATKLVQYTYTVADRVATTVYPSGGTAVVGRDVLGRITSIGWRASGAPTPTSLLGSVAYLPFGPATTLTFGNGRAQTKAYDQDYAIDRISGTPAGALTLDFGVDVMGDITSASGTINPTTPDRLYQYDALYRLTGATTGSSSPLEAYTYNKTGDRQTAALNGGTPTVYAYAGPGHRLTGVGGVARTYDNNGNTLTGTLGVPGFTLTYDDRNRLATATKGTTTVTNQYNGRGERVSKSVDFGGLGSPTAVYVYDEGGRLLADDTTEYIYLDATPVGLVRGGVLYYVETDHLGTPRQVVRPTGNVVVWKWDLLGDTFGNSVPNEDPDADAIIFAMNQRFAGQVYGLEFALSYNYSRYYEPATGRYIESDAEGLDAGTDTYSYVSNSPLAYVDPKGNVAFIPIAVGVGAGLVFDYLLTKYRKEHCTCSATPLGQTGNGVNGGVAGGSGPFSTKPRVGISGGGPSGSATSAFSEMNHAAASAGAYSVGTRRAISWGLRRLPYVSAGIVAYEVYDALSCD